MVKTCFVPTCSNRSEETPNKIFVRIPRDLGRRQRWYDALNRSQYISKTGNVFCCEDHFDLERDMENWMKYRTIGSRIRMKPEVVPHKYIHSPKRTESVKSQVSSSSKKGKQRNMIPLGSKVVRKFFGSEEHFTLSEVPARSVPEPGFSPSLENHLESSVSSSHSGKMDQDEEDLTESYGSVKLEPVEDYLEDRPELIFIQSLDNYIDRSRQTTAAPQVNPQQTPPTAAIQQSQSQPGSSSGSVSAKPTELFHSNHESCWVQGCKNNNADSLKDSLDLFSIPTDDPKLRFRWMKNLKTNPAQIVPSDYSKVCHLHFMDVAFTDATKHLVTGRKLKPGAIPIVFPWSKLTPVGKSNYKPRKTLVQTTKVSASRKAETTPEISPAIVNATTGSRTFTKLQRPLQVISAVKREAVPNAPVIVDESSGRNSTKPHCPLQVTSTVKRKVPRPPVTVYEAARWNPTKLHRPLQVNPTMKRETVPEEAVSATYDCTASGNLKFKVIPTTKRETLPEILTNVVGNSINLIDVYGTKRKAAHKVAANIDYNTSENLIKFHTIKREALSKVPVDDTASSKSVHDYMTKLSTCITAINECLSDLEAISTILDNKDHLPIPKHFTDEVEGCTNYIDDSINELESISRALSNCMINLGENKMENPIKVESPIQENSVSDKNSLEEKSFIEDDSLIQEEYLIQEENSVQEETAVKIKTELVEEEQEIQHEELNIKEEVVSDDEQFLIQNEELQIEEEYEMESVVTPKQRTKVVGFSFKNDHSYGQEADIDNSDIIEPVVMKQPQKQMLGGEYMGGDKPVVIDDDKINVLLEHSYAMSWVGGYDGQPEGGWIKCKMCMYRCRHQERMDTHFDENHVPKQCSQCSFTANSLALVRRHFVKEHPTQSGTWQGCPHCDFSAVTKKEMTLHIRLRHTDVRGWGRGTAPKRPKIAQVHGNVDAEACSSVTSK